MGFYGLFIGIDKYQSDAASNLNCAVKDANALYGLFSDTLGKDCNNVVLSDDIATTINIKSELNKLSQCSSEDIVFISYSGHGTETHELVPYDFNPRNLSNTSLKLKELQNYFEKIPAKTVVLLLDCCFSGELGSKVLKTEVTPRAYESEENLIDQLAGEGRIIITASKPNEPAWEKTNIGHGLLTYFFLEALQGAKDVQENEKVSIFKLLHFVSKSVSNEAKNLGCPQTPTIKGNINSNISWPIFKPGKIFNKLFPDRSGAKASIELHSLEKFGFPSEIIDKWSSSIPSLNKLQVSAINDHKVLENKHVVVSAPTSSGKTMIGELSALKNVVDNKKALFLFPLKALVNDKLRQFEALYSEFGVKTIEATGESDDITPLIRGKYDIALLTYEKFLSVALSFPHIIAQVGTIVIDEIQMIADKSRGVNLEFVLTLLKMRREIGIEPQIIALSAVIGNTNGLEDWLSASLLLKKDRPIPLNEGLISRSGHLKYIDGVTFETNESLNFVTPHYSGKFSSQDIIIPLVKKILNDHGQVIVFRETKGEVKGSARYLARDLGLPPASKALSLLTNNDSTSIHNDLKYCLQNGVAFHNSDLSREERLIVEEHFREGDIKAISATTTLAMGINTPASDVIVVGLNHPPNTPYSIAEYKNLIGRAGRLGYSERGRSFLIAKPGLDHSYWNKYVLGIPEDIVSNIFADETDIWGLILRIVSQAQKSDPTGMSATDIIIFLDASFGAFVEERNNRVSLFNKHQIEDALIDLKKYNLINVIEENVLLTELGMIAGESAITARSFIRLLECIENIQLDDISDPEIILLAQVTEELDQIYIPIHNRSTKERQTWHSALSQYSIRQVLIDYLSNSINEINTITRRKKKTIACLAYIDTLTLDQIERFLTKHMRPQAIIGSIRSTTARTCDVLPTIGQLLEYVNPNLDLADRVNDLIIRLTTGANSKMVYLARYTLTKLTRGDYLQIMKNGLSSYNLLKEAGDEKVLTCIENDTSKLEAIKKAIEKDSYRVQNDNDITLNPYTS